MELKRVVNKKSIVYCLLLIAFTLGYYMYCQSSKIKITDNYGDVFYCTKNEYYSEYSKFCSETIGNTNFDKLISEKIEYYTQHEALYNLYVSFNGNSEDIYSEMALLGFDNERVNEFWNLLEKNSEFVQTKDWNLKHKQCDELYNKYKNTLVYKSSIESISQNAEELLSLGTIVKKNTFTYKNLIKTKDDFKKIQDVNIDVVNDYGIRSVLDISIIPYLILIMAIVIPTSFLEERKKGLWNIVHQSTGGRTRLSLIRSGICVIGSIVISMITYLALYLLAFFKYGGYDCLLKPIQCVKGFEKCIYKVSTLEMLLLIGIFVGLAVGVLVLLTNMFMELFRTVFPGIILLLGTIAGSWIMYSRITDQMTGAFFKYFNFASILDASTFFSKYTNIRIFNEPFFRPRFELGFIVIIGAIIIVLKIMIANKVKPVAEYSAIASFISRAMVIKEKMVEKLAWGLKEAYYQLFVNKMIIVFIVGFFLVFDTKIYTGELKTKANYALDEAYIELSGQYSDKANELSKYIDELTADISEVETEYSLVKEKYLSGEVNKSEAIKYFALNENLGIKRGLRYALCEQQEYLEKKAKSNVWIIDNRGYDLWMSEQYAKHLQVIAVVGILGVIFFISVLYEEDRKKGLYDIINASSGRRRFAIKKRIVLGCMVFVYTFGLFLIDFLLMKKTFGLSYFSASVHSIKKWNGLPIDISIWMFIALILIGKATFMVLVSQLGLCLVKKRSSVVAIMILFIVLLPYLFTVIGWNGFKTIDISRLFVYFENYYAGV